MSRILVAVAAVLVWCGLAQPADARVHTDAAGPTRILIVGDSVTNGSVGDWTWRYRLWNNLVGSGADVDFVGPNTGVLDAELDTVNAMEYADSNFDVDHAARWGMSLAFPDHPVGELVAEYHADVVVEDLGLNDLTWLQGSPEVAADLARRFVGDVRAANPAASVVLTQLPQDWIDKTAEFNALLEDLAVGLDEPGARVVVAEAPVPFVLDEDTWDLAHPSATGEVKIARSVAEALAEVGVGSDPAAFPDVVNGPPTPPVLSTTRTMAGLARLSWTMPLGATGVQMWRRLEGEDWHEVDARPVLGVRPGQTAQVRVQAFKGSAVSPSFSNVVTVSRGPR
jgi:lysophospholipase L1-like esterase